MSEPGTTRELDQEETRDDHHKSKALFTLQDSKTQEEMTLVSIFKITFKYSN